MVENRRKDPEEERSLLEAIVRDPSDSAAYLAYSAWLTEHADALGELISVGLALEQPGAHRAASREREQALVATLAARFFGRFAGEGTVVWRRGFALRFAFGVDEPCRAPRIADLLAAYLLSPAALVLRDLVLGDLARGDMGETGQDATFETDETTDYAPALAALAAQALPRTMRRFAIGPQRFPLDQASVGSLAPALARMPDLEVLVVAGTNIDLGAPSLPRLRRLELTTRSPSAETLAALSSFASLETVSIDLGSRGALGALARAVPQLPATTKSINLRGLPSTAGIVDALLAWKHIDQLEELTVARSALDASDIRKLLPLVHLTRLDLTGQPLPSDLLHVLHEAFGDRLAADAGLREP